MKDLAILVDQQGNTLTNIEDNITATKNYISNANDSLKLANKNKIEKTANEDVAELLNKPFYQ